MVVERDSMGVERPWRDSMGVERDSMGVERP